MIGHKFNNRRMLSALFVAVALVFCEWHFFRNLWFSDALFGDSGDGRLTNLIAEHWWKFFRGEERFSELSMFFPAENVLGYTDFLLLYGIIHSFFRMIGFGVYVAYKWTLITVHVTGTVSMYYLLKNKVKCRSLWALFGTIAFSFSDTLAQHTIHTQLIAVSILPVLAIFLFGFFEQIHYRKKRNIYAYLFLLFFVLTAYNSWYIACFTGIFLLLFAVVFCCRVRGNGLKLLEVLKIPGKTLWIDLIGYGVFTVVLFIPFLSVYIPVLKESSGYSYGSVVPFLPEFADLINVSEDNLFMGKIVRKMKLETRGFSSELQMGFSIVLLAMFLFFLIYDWRKSKNVKSEKLTDLLPGAMFVTIMASFMLVVRLSSNGVSLWIIVCKLIPFMKSIRAVCRFLLWLSFPVAIVVAYCGNKYLMFEREVVNYSVTFFFIVLVFLSNVRESAIPTAWNVTDELSFIENVAAPPKEAEVFYIIDSDEVGKPEWAYQLDAFDIASKFSVKTINGYSGQFPKDWWGMWNVCEANYENNVFSWVEDYQIENVFAYDIATNEWISFSDRKEKAVTDIFSPKDNMFSVSEGLVDATQGDFSWTTCYFKTEIRNADIAKRGLEIFLHAEGVEYLQQNPSLNPQIEIIVDGVLAKVLSPGEEYYDIILPMDGHPGDSYTIEIRTNCYFNPEQIGMSGDNRDLSLALFYIGPNRNEVELDDAA